MSVKIPFGEPVFDEAYYEAARDNMDFVKGTGRHQRVFQKQAPKMEKIDADKWVTFEGDVTKVVDVWLNEYTKELMRVGEAESVIMTALAHEAAKLFKKLVPHR